MLEFRNVTGMKKKFVLKDISFTLPKGYMMGLVGKNGAGKTTLIDYIVNPKKMYVGEIFLDGMEIGTNHVKAMEQIGFVSEENRFFKEESAGKNAELLGALYSNWNQTLFQETMEQMNLSDGKKVGGMSRGELMKFQMAFAIAHMPKLYLLDEVTAGMDPVFRIEFFQILQKIISEENASVLMATHIKEEMERKMDYVGILEQGSMSFFGEALL